MFLFRVLTPCRLVGGYLLKSDFSTEDTDGMFLQNVGVYPQGYPASNLQQQRHSSRRANLITLTHGLLDMFNLILM
jgi:hypothetical protein